MTAFWQGRRAMIPLYVGVIPFGLAYAVTARSAGLSLLDTQLMSLIVFAGSAQLNVGRLVAPLDDPRIAGFVDDLDRINALADAHPGFVWRLQDDAGAATSYRLFDDSTLVNLSVWETVDDLFAYTYRSAHLEPLRRRQEWFLPFEGPHLVLWWVPAGHRPTLDEAGERLERLRRGGPTAEAFTFQERFEPPT